MEVKMSLKKSNEITVKIKGNLKEFYKIIESKNFKIVDKFSMNDSYFIPEKLKLSEMSTRKILSNAILIRDIRDKISGETVKKITFKIKQFDEDGNIVNQSAINCNVYEVEEAKKLFEAIGYKQIMNIYEEDIVYEKDGFQLAIKDIKNGEKLIEVETEESEELNTIDKLIKKINEINIPIYTDNYFVKKAEIELDKILGR